MYRVKFYWEGKFIEKSFTIWDFYKTKIMTDKLLNIIIND